MLNDIETPTIVAALKAGRMADAEQAARERVEQRADDVEALMLLALAINLQGKATEAADLYGRLIELQPHEPAHRNNLGMALREAGDLAGAEREFRALVEAFPENATAATNLGLLRWQQGDAVGARQHLLVAARIDPSLPDARIYGALACIECVDGDAARRLLVDAPQWPYLGPVFEKDLATALIQTDRSIEAEQRLRALLGIPEVATIARLRLASLMERLNRLDEAETLLASVQPGPEDREDLEEVHASLAARRGRHDQAIQAYKSLLEGRPQTPLIASRYFALAKSCDAVGDYAGAMEALRTAHDLQMAQAVRLVPELASPDSEPLTITQFRVHADDYARWKPDPGAPAPFDSPIFIVGFSRSGTTLLEQMLDAHPGLRAMDERAFLQDVVDGVRRAGDGNLVYPDDLDRLTPAEMDELRAIYWRKVATVVQLAPGERLVDKNPLNLLRLPMIHRIFPNARIILALRHPCDVIISNYMQDFRAAAYQVLCSTLQRLARGYVNAMNFGNHHIELFDAAVLELRYEDLLDDVVGQTKRIAAHLDLDDAAALERFHEHARAKGFISTPSYSQVVEPLNKKAVGRWQRYREYFEPILPTLEPLMQRWNYNT